MKKGLVIFESICTLIHLACLSAVIYFVVKNRDMDVAEIILLSGSFIWFLFAVLFVFIPQKLVHIIYALAFKMSKGYNNRTNEPIVSEQDCLHHTDRGIKLCFICANVFVFCCLLIQIFSS